MCQPKFNGDSLTAEFVHGKVQQSMEMFNYSVQLPPVGGGRVLKGKHLLQKDLHRSHSAKLKKRSDVIQLRPTDRVIRDVSKILTCMYFLIGFLLFSFSLAIHGTCRYEEVTRKYTL